MNRGLDLGVDGHVCGGKVALADLGLASSSRLLLRVDSICRCFSWISERGLQRRRFGTLKDPATGAELRRGGDSVRRGRDFVKRERKGGVELDELEESLPSGM